MTWKLAINDGRIATAVKMRRFWADSMLAVSQFNHDVFNVRNGWTEKESFTWYISHLVIMAVFCLNSNSVDFVVFAGGTGQGAMMSLNSFNHRLVCGLCWAIRRFLLINQRMAMLLLWRSLRDLDWAAEPKRRLYFRRAFRVLVVKVPKEGREPQVNKCVILNQ